MRHLIIIPKDKELSNIWYQVANKGKEKRQGEDGISLKSC